MKTLLRLSLAAAIAAAGSAFTDEKSARADEKSNEKAEQPLSAAEVRKVVEGRLSDVKACMKQHAPDGPTGKVVVRYLIVPTGKVDKPSVSESSTGNKALDQCIVALFPKLQFPPPRGGATMEQLYPFTFAPTPKNSAPPAQTAQPGGGLEREKIQATIQSHNPDILACYEKALASEPKLAGTVVVEMTVDKEGRIAKTAKLESNTKYVPVDECILAAVAKWQFPKPQGGGNVVIAYPFKLEHARKEP